MNEEEEKKNKKRLLLLLLLLLLFIAAIIGTVIFLKDDGKAEASGDEISITSTQEANTNDEKNKEENSINEDVQTMTELFALNKSKDRKASSNVNNTASKSKEIRDTKAPEISGVEEGKWYGDSISININDDSEYTATLTDGEGNTVSYTSGKQITEDGKYTLKVTDEAGNETTVSFGIDKTAPVVTDVPEITNKEVTPKVEDLSDVKATLNGEKYTIGTTITEEGEYELVVTDEAGNTTTVTFEIDKTAPVVTDVPQITNQDVTPKVEDTNKVKATLNGEEYTIGTPITEEGEYELVVTDEAGNTTKVNFVIDKTAPTVLLKDVQRVYYKEIIEADKNIEYTDKGAIVTDNFDPDTEIPTPTNIRFKMLFGISIPVSKVNMRIPGTYILTYTYTDAAGNISSATREVKVQDTTKPVITLNGENEVKIEAGIETYIELGATVTDNVDPDVNNLRPSYILRYGRFTTIARKIDTSKPGSYGVVYFYMDAAGNMSTVTRKVTVQDTTKPTVLLKDVQEAYYEETIEADKTAEYVDLGATVTDNVDSSTEITATNINYTAPDGTINSVSKVDMGVPGEYRLEYEYTDAAGNTGIAVRVVKIQDTTKPTVLLKDVQEAYYEETIEADKTAEYVDTGATVTDNVDPDTEITATRTEYITFFGFGMPVSKVDMGRPGTYRLTYSYTDAAGNRASATRIVKVVDTTKPVITPNGGSEVTIEAGIETYTELGATVTDNVDRDIDNLRPLYILRYGRFTTFASRIDTSKPGSYGVVYFYMDAAGNAATVIRTVKVVDTTKPTVLLKDVQKAYYEETIEADKTAEYVDVGATVTDNVDPDCEIPVATNINYIAEDGTVTPVSKVDMGVPGEYRLGYTYTDAAGNTAMARRIVKVVDTTKPTVLLKDVQKAYYEETIEADKTAEYVDVGATVTDNVDPDCEIPVATNINYIALDGTVTPVSKVDMGVPGEYRLGYTYTDAAGNTAMARRIIKVVDTTKPTVLLKDVQKAYYEETIEADKTAEYVDAGATVTDNVDSDCEIPVATNINYIALDGTVTPVSKVDMGVPGEYRLGYTYTDAAGNTAMARRIVTIQDTTAPVITLNGEARIIIEAGLERYTEQGATVTDNVDETITDMQPAYINYSVNGVYVGKVDFVDSSKPGTYKVVYEYTDAAGNKGVDASRADHEYVIRVVTVQDTTAPQITLNGEARITIEAGIERYIEQGATVTDNVDETITNLQPAYINYSVDGRFVGRVDSIDNTKLGTYKVVYEYTDAAGNIGVDYARSDHEYVIRVVTVQDTTAPVITLNGEKNVTIEAGIGTYTELGATVTDNVDETITNLQPSYINYSVNGAYVGKVDFVDTTKLGTYKVVYEYTDAAGNKGVDAARADHEYAMRIVTVQDTTLPTITVKDGYVGDKENKAFSNVSFKLYDKYGVSAYKVNGGEYVAVTVNQWSDANFDNIKSGLVNGTNTITVKDTSGNETSYTFIYDTIAPILNVTGNPTTWQNTDAVLLISAIDNESGIKRLTVNGEDITGQSSYTVGTNGTYVFVATDYVGNAVTETVVVNRIDKTAPTVTTSLNLFRTVLNVRATDSQSGVKSVVVNVGGISEELLGINGTYTHIFRLGAISANRYVLTVTDNAGNQTIINANN